MSAEQEHNFNQDDTEIKAKWQTIMMDHKNEGESKL